MVVSSLNLVGRKKNENNWESLITKWEIIDWIEHNFICLCRMIRL